MMLMCAGALSACGETSVSSNAPLVDGDRPAGPVGTPVAGSQYFLVANGSSNIVFDAGAASELSVFLYSKSTGNPVSEETVKYEVLEGAGFGALSALNSFTDGDGMATIALNASETPGNMRIKVSHAAATPIEFNISIQARAVGGIDVKLTNTAPTIMDLKDIDVRLYENVGYSCNEFLPLRQQPEGLQLRPTPTTALPVAFDSLPITQSYMLTAVARGPRGQLAAGGCVEDVRVAGSERTNVEVPLQLIPINPVGRYEVQSYWDFTKAVEESGAVGSIITRILNVFNNPGQAIYDEIINLVNYAVGGIISGAINTFLDLTGLDDDFQNLINNAVENNDTLRRVRDAGRDVRDVIANLHVTSELIVGKLSSSYEFTGVDNWHGVTVYWRWNCPDNAPPECGAIPLLVDGTSDVAELGILSSNWSGRVVAYDDLQIDQHPLTLRYGRLIIYILNEVVLPTLTNGNAHSMSEAFAHWIGCDNIARGITGSDNEVCALGACIYADDIENFCGTAVGTVFGFADTLVRSLEFDIGLRVGGEAKLIEETSDGFVDRMTDGTFEGFMTSSDSSGQGGGAAAPIKATWSAEKLDYNTNNL